MLRDLLGLEEDGDEVVVRAHENLLGREPPGNRVAIAVERDTEHLGYARALDVVGVEWRSGDRLEQPLFLVLEHELRDLAGHLVHTSVGEVIAPADRLRVEVEQIAEAAAGPESATDEAD